MNEVTIMEFEFKQMVSRLVKPGEDICREMTPRSAHLIHMAMGISGESGELLDAIKKYSIYGKPIDMVNVVEELGDLEFFLEGLRQELGIPRALTLTKNIEKLAVRYKQNQYTNEAAIAREDKRGDPNG